MKREAFAEVYRKKMLKEQPKTKPKSNPNPDPKLQKKPYTEYDLSWCSCDGCRLIGKYDWCGASTPDDSQGGCPYGSKHLIC
jgi:hypothetical protein